MAEVFQLTSSKEQPPVLKAQEIIVDKDIESANDFKSIGQSGSIQHHDSEYDTASDLDDGEIDDYEDEENEEEGGVSEDDVSDKESAVIDTERQRGDGQEQSENLRKADEDRSNPQYIPKKGTFYEHDDRTAEEPVNNEKKTEEVVEKENTNPANPSTQTTRTMKKWQPASVGRWSHDRFEAKEQAPKSRAELVSAYGYDIRNEDGPPRARRRRHYARGPNKYERKWEDESAYIRPPLGNPQRKPRNDEFPPLENRESKFKRSKNFREEKENHYDRRHDRVNRNQKEVRSTFKRDGKFERRNNGKNFHSDRDSKELRNKNNVIVSENYVNRTQAASVETEDKRILKEESKLQVETLSFTNTKLNSPSIIQSERLNGQENIQKTTQMMYEGNDRAQSVNSSQLSSQNNQNSNLVARLQHQTLNEPAHVGSVQMHSIASQNLSDIQQSTSSDVNRTKRYSSLRQRAQNDISLNQTPGIEQHNIKSIQMHDIHQVPHQIPHQAPQQHVIGPEHNLLQANLMHLYHNQENIQSQLQSATMANLTNAHQSKPQYPNIQQQYQTNSANNSSYYTAPNEFITNQTQVNSPTQFNQAPTNAYIQQQQPTAQQLPYNPQNQPSGSSTQQIPTGLNYVPAPPQAGAPTAPPFQSFPSYQNYNTVGGTTYFVSQPQPPPRPVILPQRRPTNAIPILAPPSDKSKLRSDRDDEIKTMSNVQVDSMDNIDHILDNMFVQRQPFLPPARTSSSPTREYVSTIAPVPQIEENVIHVPINTNIDLNENQLEESVKNLTIIEKSEDDENTQSPAEGEIENKESSETG